MWIPEKNTFLLSAQGIVIQLKQIGSTKFHKIGLGDTHTLVIS